jgi:hypothetical protein
MERRGPAVHRTIVAVDIEGFGDRNRTNVHQVAVRDGLYQALRQAFENAHISRFACEWEDRGDGVFILAPADVPKAPFVDTLPSALVSALREHNAGHPTEQRIRLRMVLHAGEVSYDDHGVTAVSVNLAFRLLDAKPVRTALARSPGVLVVVASEWFFDEVVRHSYVVDPATFRPAPVTVKETSTVGWISLPDHPYAADRTFLVALSAPSGPVPHELPAAPRSFTGRADELARLTGDLGDAAGRGRTVVPARTSTCLPRPVLQACPWPRPRRCCEASSRSHCSIAIPMAGTSCTTSSAGMPPTARFPGRPQPIGRTRCDGWSTSTFTPRTPVTGC